MVAFSPAITLRERPTPYASARGLRTCRIPRRSLSQPTPAIPGRSCFCSLTLSLYTRKQTASRLYKKKIGAGLLLLTRPNTFGSKAQQTTWLRTLWFTTRRCRITSSLSRQLVRFAFLPAELICWAYIQHIPHNPLSYVTYPHHPPSFDLTCEQSGATRCCERCSTSLDS